MKYLLVLLVVVVGAWLLLGRAAGRGQVRPRDDARGKPGPAPAPAPMLACAHCGVHMPDGELLRDERGRPFCSEAHRSAGPR